MNLEELVLSLRLVENGFHFQRGSIGRELACVK
jgi:hypothetical protein